eukprot:15358343-Ditylum_brightwellii.AAC.1
MAEGNEIMDSHQEARQTTRAIAIIRDGCDCNWIPSPSSALAQVEITNGMVMWEHFTCCGIVDDNDVKQDDTFQMHLDFLDELESSLLQNVDVQYLIHQVIMELGQSNFIIAIDRSSGTDSMSFSWKICTQQGKTLVQHSGSAFGQTSLFRSEVYRILSVLLLLYYAKEYAQDDKCLNF